jgi:hypothetical protein
MGTRPTGPDTYRGCEQDAMIISAWGPERPSAVGLSVLVLLRYGALLTSRLALSGRTDDRLPGVLGSDYPFPLGDFDPVRSVREAHLGAEATQAILGENAEVLFRLG